MSATYFNMSVKAEAGSRAGEVEEANFTPESINITLNDLSGRQENSTKCS